MSAVLAVAVVNLFAMALTGAVFNPVDAQDPGVDPAAALGALLAVSLLNATILVMLARGSRMGGRWLAGWLFAVYFLVAPVLSLMESVFFEVGPDAGTSLRLMGSQGLAILLVALAVPFLTGRRGTEAGTQPDPLPSAGRLAGGLGAGAVLYLGVYLAFGYFVAWQSDAVRSYYGAQEMLPLVAHLRSTWAAGPHLFVFQLLRGVIWMALALFIVRRLSTGTVAAALLVGLTFSVLMGSALLLPNPFMPEAVRMVHLVEVTTSNLLFGALAGGLWHVLSRPSRAEPVGA